MLSPLGLFLRPLLEPGASLPATVVAKRGHKGRTEVPQQPVSARGPRSAEPIRLTARPCCDP